MNSYDLDPSIRIMLVHIYKPSGVGSYILCYSDSFAAVPFVILVCNSFVGQHYSPDVSLEPTGVRWDLVSTIIMMKSRLHT